MLTFIPQHCTCRNHVGEQTNLSKYQPLLAQFKEDHPGKNITAFFEEHKITRMCCRNAIMGPWKALFNDSTLEKYLFHRSDPKHMPRPDLSHLKTNLNEELSFPK